jgi:hypothetical protein
LRNFAKKTADPATVDDTDDACALSQHRFIVQQNREIAGVSPDRRTP